MTHEIKTKVIVAEGGSFVIQRLVGKQRWKHLTSDMVSANRVVDLFETSSAFYYDIIARRAFGTSAHCKLRENLKGEVLTYHFRNSTVTKVDIFCKEAVNNLLDEIITDVGVSENVLTRSLRKDYLARIINCQREARGHGCESFLHYVDRSPVMVSDEDMQELMRLHHNSDRRFNKANHARKAYLPNRKELAA